MPPFRGVYKETCETVGNSPRNNRVNKTQKNVGMALKKVFLGIDPGQRGGLVAIRREGIDAIPMPDSERDIWNWFSTWGALVEQGSHEVVAVIEDVHSMPQQSAQSGFTFGWGYGGLRMAMIACHISFQEISPRVWQKGLKIGGKKKGEKPLAWKNRLRVIAQQWFPKLPIWSEPKSKGRQLAISDALLICEFCRRKTEGLL